MKELISSPNKLFDYEKKLIFGIMLRDGILFLDFIY